MTTPQIARLRFFFEHLRFVFRSPSFFFARLRFAFRPPSFPDPPASLAICSVQGTKNLRAGRPKPPCRETGYLVRGKSNPRTGENAPRYGEERLPPQGGRMSVWGRISFLSGFIGAAKGEVEKCLHLAFAANYTIFPNAVDNVAHHPSHVILAVQRWNI